MDKLIQTQINLDWIPEGNTVETYLSSELPKEGITAAYAIVFKDEKFLMTDLREGERPTRRLDIPGGHIDEGESPEQACIREAYYEETGVVVSIIKLVAYSPFVLTIPKPENYKYPYPKSYMVFYLCEAVREDPFEGNDSTHGRVWLAPEDFHKSQWCIENKIFLDEVIKLI